MNEINDGGPAFPSHGSMGEVVQEGMTLRDFFAASAAATIWIAFQNDGTAKQHSEWRQGVAVEAYRLADEMLTARD